MPYEKLQLGGAQNEILSWANHEFSIEEQNYASQRFAFAMLVQARRANA